MSFIKTKATFEREVLKAAMGKSDKSVEELANKFVNEFSSQITELIFPTSDLTAPMIIFVLEDIATELRKIHPAACLAADEFKNSTKSQTVAIKMPRRVDLD